MRTGPASSAPGVAAAAASSAASQPGAGRQSASVKTSQRALAPPRAPALRAA